ncbi:MAG TPA: hypothetical protein VIX82_11450, partial [Solirubrobacteraceae bacterium]
MAFQETDIGARRTGRTRWSRTVIALVIVGGLLPSPLEATGASGGLLGLTVSERRAITITSLSAVAAPSLGLVVRVTFAGELERDLGQGNLRDGVLALVVTPVSGTRAASGVIDAGGGLSRLRFLAPVRHGQRLTARPAAVSMFGSERVRALGAPEQPWVVRHGNEVILYLARPGPRLPATMKLKVFARAPLVTRALAGGSRSQLARAWHEIVVRRATIVHSVTASATSPSCGQLTALAKQLAATLSGLAAELRQQGQAERALRSTVRQFDRVVRAIGGARQPIKSELSRGLAKITATIVRLRGEIAAGERLLVRVGSLANACNQPPPPPPPPPPSPPPPAPVSVVQTDPALSQQLTPRPGLGFSAVRPQGVPVIDVSEQVRYQQFAGLGANLTDSAAWLIYTQLSPVDRTRLMQQLFGATGIHLSFLRTAMGASGAMTVNAAYSYDDVPQGQTDPTLSQFSIAHDLPYI